jgi:hypothetical protein
MGEYSKGRVVRHAAWVITRVIWAGLSAVLFLVFVLTIKVLGGE